MWFKVDDAILDHPKWQRLGRQAVINCLGLWTAAGAWSGRNGTDGFIPRSVITQYPNSLRSAARLVAVGLWSEATQDGLTGYQFHDWSQWQPMRADLERLRRSRAEAGSKGGRASGKTRGSKTEASASGLVEANRTPEPEPEPEPVDRPPTPPARSAPRSELDRFAEFYAAYPRRVGRRDAEKAWAAAMKRGVDADHAITAADRYADECRGREARYIAHPATWLNQGRYDDEPAREHRPRSRAEEWVALGAQMSNNGGAVVDAEVIDRKALP